METELRTDSADYRTELLSPAAAGESSIGMRVPSWRLNFNEHSLPERNKEPLCGFGNVVHTLRKQRKIADYYKRQENVLKGFNEVDSFVELGVSPKSSAEEELKELARSEAMAIRISNAANLVLFVAKVYASVESRSLAVIASTLDSLLDLLSGFILWFTASAMRKPNHYRYPIGKKRMQPGIIVFASVMATLGLQILFESARELVIKSQPEKDPGKEKWMIGIMVSVTVIKFILMVYCRQFKNEIVRAYAQDHLFDVITNSVGLVTAVLAVRFFWWIDPLGAIIIALYTMSTWAKTVMENVWSLIGRTAPPEYLTKLLYLIWNHNEEIEHIDTVRAYTFGSNYFVEVDIVLPGDMSLGQAHNIGETLQEKLEQLPEVERAFVHIDFESRAEIRYSFAAYFISGGRSELLHPNPDVEQSSWRLNAKEFRLPERRRSDHSSYSFRRLLPSPRKQGKIAEYYKKQERLLEGFNEMETIHESGCLPGSLTEDEMKQLARSERMAVRVSNIANFVLFLAKVYASVESRSLAVMASTLDSLLDLLSGFILWFTAYAMKNPNQYHYPIGKKRMQPVGIIVFASVMATLGLQILFESIRELITKSRPEINREKEKWMIGIMVSVTVVKFLLMVYCRRFKNEIIRAYAQDHLFDVVTNSVGLATAVLAVRFFWWIDPTGAIIIALYTMTTWAKTVIENVWLLIGRTAPPEFLAKLTYLIWNHHEEIKHIDTVRAYTFGSHYFVEVDIVLPEDMHLSQAHNIGETLQEKLEQLLEVERAFVHIDFEFTHRPEHKTKV
ncbi:hypothetical protein F0562_008568 [Nyssa sinensis]|uniref:Cation efflux protein cytoplasmic domain-containing protein n=1 Tax=Nyssa sinensis TaxID=561372 RepID=A0A5J5A8G7_9ASTE|nr:hypothetical protein F0562_008568 [Nyssa sinensis]